MLSSKTPDLSYRRLAAKGRRLSKQSEWPECRLAILSDAASQQFLPVLRALFSENEVNAEFYEGGFDAIELEALNPESGLYSFKPDVIILAFATQALRSRYFRDSSDDFAKHGIERIRQIWEALRKHTAAHIIQFNYVMPYERFFGSYDIQVPQSLYASTLRFNAQIAESAASYTNISVCDVEAISSHVGRSQWFDDKLWNLSKTFCRLEHLPLVCQSIVDIVMTAKGRILKCIILDLDNTLWGGVVGDLGHLGIEIGAHGDGEPFFHFQSYLLALKKRGIILAVCSKNDLENALQPFTDNPDMVLRRDDFAVFIANWENKADNIKTIRDRLNIGLDSMVFLDDNPFERNLVRQFLPEVTVPELPEDPAEYVQFVSGLNLFETVRYTADDARRAQQYKEEADRLELRAKVADVGEYLKTLDMQLRISRFDSASLPRIAQLTQRSNQFNLTTQRMSEEECRQMMLDHAACFPLQASLTDRFGDHGLISVITLQICVDALSICNWLMSCRVLARGVEETLMNFVVRFAMSKQLSRIDAQYMPTAKNSMVKDFFAKFGFVQTCNQDGHTRWSLDPANYQTRATYISEV